jgi:predicted glycoside hydrolase/deacetylase ChbG (UPF0249 family)
MMIASALALFAVAASGPAGDARTLAERLGRARDAKLLIVHADDLGEWHAINGAAFRAFATGLVNSGSMMVPCPWFPEMAAWAKEHPETDLGLHLTVTSERTAYRWGPVASRDRVPSLLDPQGYFRKIQAEATAAMNAGEVEVELRAQVDRALSFGLKPTHLDAHQFVLFDREDLFAALVRVSRAYGIPVSVARNHLESHPYMASALGPTAPVLDRTFDIPPGVAPEKWGDWYEAELRKIGPGITEIIMHVGLDDAELQAATADRPTWGAEWRQRDFDFFTSERFRSLVKELGLTLVTWRQIGALGPPPAAR